MQNVGWRNPVQETRATGDLDILPNVARVRTKRMTAPRQWRLQSRSSPPPIAWKSVSAYEWVNRRNP
jgi:hypothetical protein